MSSSEESNTSVGPMVTRLMDEAKMSAADISEALGQRVSRRTVYRWKKGESTPQQKSDLDALAQIYRAKFRE